MSVECEYCPGAEVIVTRREIRGGSLQYVYQCLGCGEPIGSAIAKAKVLEWAGTLNVPAFDAALAPVCREERAQTARQVDAQRKQDWFAQYNLYLASDAWKRRRALVLQRAAGSCEGCGVAAAAEVHHLTYANAGAEFLFELVAMCADCHQRFHAAEEARDLRSARFVWGAE